MNKNTKVLVGVLSVVFIMGLASCCKTYQCGPYKTGSFRISNFTSQESDTIIIRAYKQGTNFAQKLDSVLLAKDKNADYRNLEDGISTEVSINFGVKFALSSLYDFEFYFPATNTLRRLTEIKDNQSEIRRCSPVQKKECTNQLASLRLDGVVYTYSANTYSGIPYLLK